MYKNKSKWTAAALLALGLCGMTAKFAVADDEDEAKKKAIAAAQAAILKLTDGVGGPSWVKDTEALAKAHKLEPVMIGFKPKSKGGIGIG